MSPTISQTTRIFQIMLRSLKQRLKDNTFGRCLSSLCVILPVPFNDLVSLSVPPNTVPQFVQEEADPVDHAKAALA